MKQIVTLSGKGGTGKTTVLASFAALAETAVLADCDVDAANLYLLLHPQVETDEAFLGAQVAVRDVQRCIRCGECERRCRFEAITVSAVNEARCEGCGLCVLACPQKALRLEIVENGRLITGQTRFGPMVYARLKPGGENSGQLVARVRKLTEVTAAEARTDWVLMDGPPGIGCTATSAVVDADLAVIVTEPTLSGMHDMERVVGLAAHFAVPVAAVINKHDINAANTAVIEQFCRDNSIPVLAKVPYDETVVAANARQVPVVEWDAGPVAKALRQAWENLQQAVAQAS
jgi:MinD superfamily P-loop ATPase